jgi:hypothetical protein
MANLEPIRRYLKYYNNIYYYYHIKYIFDSDSYALLSENMLAERQALNHAYNMDQNAMEYAFS